MTGPDWLAVAFVAVTIICALQAAQMYGYRRTIDRLNTRLAASRTHNLELLADLHAAETEVAGANVYRWPHMHHRFSGADADLLNEGPGEGA